jgi:hypothetical protein
MERDSSGNAAFGPIRAVQFFFWIQTPLQHRLVESIVLQEPASNNRGGNLSQVSTAVTSRAAHSSETVPYRFTYLLISELIVIAGFPFTSGEGMRAHMFRLMAVLLIGAGLYTVLGRGRITLVAFLLGVPPMAIHAANVAGYLSSWHVAAIAMGAVYLCFMSSVFVRAVISEAKVTTDTLAGAVAAYLLIGITYGLIYAFIQQVWPGSFVETLPLAKPIKPPDLIFFSFISLTTVGYGDIVPVAGPAKSLAVLESITGVMYPAVLVGRLVGLRFGGKHES